MRAIHALNPRFCYACLDVPQHACPVDFAPCVITGCDQTASAIRAVCKALSRS